MGDDQQSDGASEASSAQPYARNTLQHTLVWDVGGQKTSIQLYEAGLVAVSERSGKPARTIVASRDELPECVVLARGVLLQTVAITKARTKIIVAVSPADMATIRGWLGQLGPRAVTTALGTTLRFNLPIAALYLLAALPVPAESGGEASPDYVSLALGLGLIVLSIGARLKPDRIFFLLDAIWFAALSVVTAFGTAAASGSIWWMAFSVFVFAIAVSRYRQYELYGSPARSSD
jgi:hypothetical protein